MLSHCTQDVSRSVLALGERHRDSNTYSYSPFLRALFNDLLNFRCDCLTFRQERLKVSVTADVTKSGLCTFDESRANILNGESSAVRVDDVL